MQIGFVQNLRILVNWSVVVEEGRKSLLASPPIQGSWLACFKLTSSDLSHQPYILQLTFTNHFLCNVSTCSCFKIQLLQMKEKYIQLYPIEQVATAVGDYAYEHSTKLPK